MVDIDINHLSEAINDKMDRDGHNVENPSAVMVESYVNGTSGYRIWSNGYCEQWGEITTGSSGGGTMVSFLKTFIDSNYILLATFNFNPLGNPWSYTLSAGSKTTTSCNIYSGATNVGDAYSGVVNWKASGYLAEGEY